MPDSVRREAQLAKVQVTCTPAAFRRRLLRWHDQNREPHPWRLLWQEQRNPYHIWLSEIMLQQTVIKAVLPAYDRFLTLFPSVYDLAHAEEATVRQACRGLGYYRRFGMLHRAAKELVQCNMRTSAEVVWPTNAEQWRELPGIGPYTSAAIASICNNDPVAVVDGNVERVLCRLLDIRLPVNLPALKKHYARWAQALLESKNPGRFNEAMMELGQKICRPLLPACDKCPVRGDCAANANGSTREAPQPKIAGRALEDVDLALLIMQRGNKFASWRRPATAKFLREAVGLPTGTWDASLEQFQWDGGRRWRLNSKSMLAVGTFRHSITHHRITGHVFALRLKSVSHIPEDLEWVSAEMLSERMVASLDTKAWRLWQKAPTSAAK